MMELEFEGRGVQVSAAWVQRLGRALAAEGLSHEDALQETWVAVLEGRMKHDASPGGWLAKVARNFALLGLRHEETVRRGERGAARPEAQTEGPEDVVARAEITQQVVDQVLALREPYRSTLLLRYLDELSAETIAQRQGVPASTVRNRLRRGLVEVRRRLGVRIPLGAAIAVWRPSVADWMARIPEVLVVMKATKLAVVGVAALVVGAWWWKDAELQSRAPGTVAEVAASLPEVTPVESRLGQGDLPVQTPSPREAKREVLPAPSSPAEEEPVPKEEPGELSIARTLLVVDLENEPVGDARVALEDLEASYREELFTDSQGRCTAFYSEGTLEVTAYKEGVGIARGEVVFSEDRGDRELRLRLIEPIRLRGIVLDPRGNPAAGARVEPAMAGLIQAADLPFSTPAMLTDSEGRFSFLLHSNGFYRLEASHDGLRSSPVDVDKTQGFEREVVLRLRGRHALEGVVLDSEGRTESGARIQAYGMEEALTAFREGGQSDEQGRFHFALPAPGAYRLVASSARAPRTTLDVEVPAGSSTRHVELVLDRPEVIAGKVVWDDGQPASGCRVYAYAEGSTPPMDVGFEITAEGAAMYGYALADADSDGNFVLSPLVQGERYSLSARPDADRARARVREHGILAGTEGVELELSEKRLRGAFVHGALSSALGETLRDVQLQLMWRPPSAAGQPSSWRSDRPRQVLQGTGPWRPFDGKFEEGRYEYAHLLPGREYVLYLTAEGHGISAVGPWIAEEAGTLLDVELHAELSLQVEVFRGDGLPAAHATASLRYLEEFQPLHFFGERYLDEEGRIGYENLLPGTYELEVVHKGQSQREDVEVTVGVGRKRFVVGLE